MEKLKKYRPFILTALIVLIDQFSKSWVIKNIPIGTIYREFFGDFLWIVHVRNTGAAFSMAAEASPAVRMAFLIVACTVLMGLLVYVIISKREDLVTKGQRWICAGILGGGMGTMFDRIFRFNEGVVDFISVNMYGFLGVDRFATFNIADSCVVCFVIAFIISEIVNSTKKGKKNEQSSGEL